MIEDMKSTNTYQTPVTEIVELYSEAAFLQASGGTDPYPGGDGFLLPDLGEGESF